jgi:hypothetical protein
MPSKNTGKINYSSQFIIFLADFGIPVLDSAAREPQQYNSVRFWEWDCFAEFLIMNKISNNLFVNNNLFAAAAVIPAIARVSDFGNGTVSHKRF